MPRLAADPPRPSYLVVLLTWAFTGLLGGHHFLLGRYLHGLLWLTSGGGFGLGWALDFFRLGRFLEDSSGSRPAEVRSVRGVLVEVPHPGLNMLRAVQHALAQWWLGLWYYGCVAWSLRLLGAPSAAHPAAVLVSLLSLWAVDNCSRTRGSSLVAVMLTGGLAAFSMSFTGQRESSQRALALCVAQLASFYTRRWRDVQNERDVACTPKQALVLGALVALLLASVVGKLALEVKAQPGASWGRKLHSSFTELLEGLGVEMKTGGGGEAGAGGGGQGGGHRFDFGGFARGASGMSRREAARLLGLNTNSPTRQQIKDAHRSLSLQHHPDKVAASEKAEAEAMQVKLNAARELLMGAVQD